MSEFNENALEEKLKSYIDDNALYSLTNFEEGARWQYDQLKSQLEERDREVEEVREIHKTDIGLMSHSITSLNKELNDLRSKLSASEAEVKRLHEKYDWQVLVKRNKELEEKLSTSEAIAPKENEMVITRKKFNHLLDRNVQLSVEKAQLQKDKLELVEVASKALNKAWFFLQHKLKLGFGAESDMKAIKEAQEFLAKHTPKKEGS